MTIRPIFSALMRNKTGPLLLALQVAVTLAVLTNAFFIVHERVIQMQRPVGVDAANQFQINVNGFGAGYQTTSEIPADVDAIRAIDGVTAVTPINTLPLSGSGWDSTFSNTPDDDGIDAPAALYFVNEHGLDALGVNLVAGRSFRPEEIIHLAPNEPPPRSSAIITRALAQKLYPDTDALGQTLYLPGMETQFLIVGIVERLVVPWVGSGFFEQSVIFPLISTENHTSYLVRTRPGMRDLVMPQVETVLTERVDNRLIGGLRSMDSIAARAYENHRAMSIIMIAVSILLLIVNALGIVGLASFQINRRRRQIGTRRALGATRGAIMGHFMIESGLIVAVGLVVGLILAVGLNYGLMNWLEFSRMELTWLPAAALVLFVLGQFAVLGPARKAAAVPPAVATRSV